MNIKLEIISPERAREILSKNSKNRSLNMRAVRAMVSQLQSGQWKQTHQGIAIGLSGELLDGQHRLTAIAKSGVSIPMLVAYDVEDTCLDVLDTGRKRTPADTFAIYGVTSSGIVASGTRVYYYYLRSPKHLWNGSIGYEITTTGLYSFFEEKIGERNTLAKSLAQKANSEWKYLVPSVIYAFVLILEDAGYKEQDIRHFINKLSKGEDLRAESPVLTYRKQVLNNEYGSSRRRHAAEHRQELLAHLIKIFNYESEGLNLTVFKRPQIPPMPNINPAPTQLAAA